MSQPIKKYTDAELKELSKNSLTEFSKDNYEIIKKQDESRNIFTGFTYFLNDEETTMTPKNFINHTKSILNSFIRDKDSISKVKAFVFQLEECPTTSSKHIHVGLKLNKGIYSFNHIQNNFPNSHVIKIQADKFSIWCGYCIKNYTRYPGTTPQFWNMSEDNCSVYRSNNPNYIEQPIATEEQKDEILRKKIQLEVKKEEMKKEEKQKIKNKKIEFEIESYKIDNHIDYKTSEQSFKVFNEDKYINYPNIDQVLKDLLSYNDEKMSHKTIINEYEKQVERWNMTKTFNEQFQKKYNRDKNEFERLIIDQINDKGLDYHLTKISFIEKGSEYVPYTIDELPKLKLLLEEGNKEEKIKKETNTEDYKHTDEIINKIKKRFHAIENGIKYDIRGNLDEVVVPFCTAFNKDINVHDKEPKAEENSFDLLVKKEINKDK